MSKTISVFLAFLWLLSDVRGQFNETYFAASKPKSVGYLFDYQRTPERCYIRASGFQRTTSLVEYIAAVAPDGEILWSTVPYADTTFHDVLYRDLVAAPDGFLFVARSLYQQGSIVCMDGATGQTIWQTQLPFAYNPVEIILKGQNELAIHIRDFQQSRIVVLQKSDGALLSDTQLPQRLEGFIVSDTEGFLYAGAGNSVLKMDKTNPAQFIWVQEVQDGFFEFANAQHAWIDPAEQSLFAFGDDNGFKGAVAKINLQDGSTQSFFRTNTDERFRDVATQGDTLYTCWLHAFFGGGSYAFSLVAIRISTGEQIYQKFYQIENPAMPPNPIPGTHSSYSLDLDEEGHAFITGNSSGAWTAVKVNISDGSKVWERIYDDTPPVLDQYSTGRVVWYTGNQQVNFIGEMQLDQNHISPAYVSVSSVDGSVLNKDTFSLEYTFPSAVVHLIPFQDGALILKQLDNCMGVARLDAGGQILWERSLSRSFFLKAGGIYPGSSPGELYLTAYSSLYDRINQTIRPDSVFVFRLDASNGSVESTWGAPADGTVFPLHLEAIGESVLFFYYRNNVAWFTEINNDGTSSVPFGFFFGIVEEQAPHIYGRHFERHNNGVYFMRLNNADKYFFAPGGTISTLSLPANFSIINDMAGLPNGDLLVVGGQTDGRFQIIRYDIVTQQADWVIPFPFSGQVNRVLVDSDSTFVVLGSSSFNSLFLQKHQISGGAFPIWTKVFLPTEGVVSVAEIIVDKAAGDLVLAGTFNILGNPSLDDKAFLLWRMDAQSNTLYQLIRYSDVPGPFNQTSTALALPDGRMLVGGRIHHPVFGKVGFVWGLPAVLNQATGRAWFDINDNQQYDAGEPAWRQFLIATPGNYLTWPDSNGLYRFFSPGTGAYDISLVSPSPWYEVQPASVQFDSTQQLIQGVDIRLTAQQQVADARIQLVLLDELRFGFPTHFLVRAENIGTIPTDSLQFSLSCGSDFSIETLVPLHDTLPLLSLPAPDLPAYRFTGLPPLAHRSFIATGNLTNLLELGDTLQCEISIQAFPEAEGDTTNNFERIYLTVVGSYDPNDIAAFPGGNFDYDQLPPTRSLGIRYRIRFQNDGNAATRFVRLENPFDTLLNPATFQLLETSAPVQVSLIGPHTWQFLYEDLALSPFSEDSVGSQGFVIYEMSTFPDLQIGDVIENRASIYFDFNPPIETNVAQTVIYKAVGVKTADSPPAPLRISPNPAPSNSRVLLDATGIELPAQGFLLDATGQMVRQFVVKSPLHEADLNGLSPGAYLVWLAGKTGKVIIR